MYKLRFENEYGKSYTFTENDKVVITLLDGFYSSSATVNTSKVGTLPGERLASKSTNKRNLGIYFNILKDVIKVRKNLYNVFTSGKKVKCYYENDENNVYIEGIVEDLTIKPHEMATTGQLIVVCPYPYFKDITTIMDGVNNIISNFKFPFSIEEPGMSFSYYDTNIEKIIFNNGSIETGMKIELKAVQGEVVNPRIYNRQTTQFIGLGTTENPFIMEAGDVVTIDTTAKRVSLYKDGKDNNIFNYLIKDITWLTLIPGDNIFTHEVSSGLAALVVTYIHQDEYEGV